MGCLPLRLRGGHERRRAYAFGATEIGVENLRALTQLVHRPTREDAPVRHDDHWIAEASNEVQLVLDEDHRLTLTVELLNVVREFLREGRVHPGEGFVEQQQLRVGHKCPRKFEQPHLPAAQYLGVVVRELQEIEALEQLDGADEIALLVLLPLLTVDEGLSKCLPAHVHRTDKHVLEDRHVAKGPRYLEGSHESEARPLPVVPPRYIATFEEDLPGVGSLCPGE